MIDNACEDVGRPDLRFDIAELSGLDRRADEGVTLA